MDLRAYAATETSAFVERLIAAAETTTTQARVSADEAIAAARADVEQLRQQLEAALAAAHEAREQATAATQNAAALTDRANALEQQAKRAATLEEKTIALEAHASALEERATSLDARLKAADAAAEAMRKQVEDANAMTDAVQDGMAVMRARTRHVTSMLSGSVQALEALGNATTVAEVFSGLVTQLAAEFPRVAIFRRKGHHLQGEHASGLDPDMDVTKLVIPLSGGSIVARAAAGTLLHVTADKMEHAHPPFGGAPASAVAAPLLFQDETLAVIYADADDEAVHDAHTAFAGVLVGHANILLSRLTQELKTARELREYARMLLHEAEQMFLADVHEARSEQDRLRRLHSTIEFGRQLFAQRAALEGSVAAGLLEDEIVALIDAKPVTPFGSALGAALAEAPAQGAAVS